MLNIYNTINTKLLSFFITLILISVSFNIYSVHANTGVQDQKYKGIVSGVLKTGSDIYGPNYQELKVKLDSGEDIKVENNPQTSAKNVTYDVDDKVILQKLIGQGEELTLGDRYIITDYYRLDYLLWLFGGFIFMALLVGKKHGFNAIIGMAFSFFVIFKFILPEIIKGNNPILITVIASVFIIPVNFYLSHGFNNKTHTAIASTILTMIITAVLTGVSVFMARLTGYSSEEAMFLQIAYESIDIRGILLSGIIIGFLGILDDVTISQASIVSQLSKVKKYKDVLDLYSDAMNVGRDHITSMINTLVLVYTGAAMPLLLLFVNNQQPLLDLLNIEMVAEEIVRTLIGSIGLILAVPLSTLIASVFAEELKA